MKNEIVPPEISRPTPPESWREPRDHLGRLLDSEWYFHLLALFSECNFSTHDFFRARGAQIAFAPVTTGSVSSPMGFGSDSIPVIANISDHTVYLADSMQFALEIALRVTGRPAYYILPSFRGEISDDRHLNQFIHAEAEIVGGLEDALVLAEDYFRHLAMALAARCRGSLDKLGGDPALLERVAGREGRFPRITYSSALRELRDFPGAFENCETGDLRITGSGERALLARYDSPVWITNMPANIVPFYQAVSPSDPAFSETADLLAGIGETIGAGSRAHNEAALLANMQRCRIAPDAYDWYLEMKRRSPVQTAGFGLGIERFLLWATGRNDIRDFAFLLRNQFGEGRP